mmetsp:Transcript_15095/g.26913  ORF Transcript_15095/g.26913 Transcript_15095/m.26913 type:complete len:113 (+) Transcript_15095:54-392(+)
MMRRTMNMLGRSHSQLASRARGKHYLLQYDYVEGILEKRAPHREGHLALAKEYFDKGQIHMGGAYGDLTGATLVFKCDNDEPLKDFMERDPYFQNGLVSGHRIKEWTVVDLS